MAGGYQVGVYYFPNYHVDPRNEQAHGTGWTEWDLVKAATPRWPGHRQPRVPLWGYEDEADPRVMARKIDAAADHGVDFWIFDWYYYDDGPYLARGLEEGFLGAPNAERLKFACMWANHDWIDIHPAKLRGTPNLQFPGAVTPATFDAMGDLLVERYFRHPCHLTIDGAQYFSIYDLTRLLASFGSVAATRAALDALRAKTRAAGFPDLHLNAVVWGQAILPGETAAADPVALLADLGFDSVTSYVWVHHAALPDFPETDFGRLQDAYLAYFERARSEYGLPYYPNVSMGWDSTPRTVQTDRHENAGYPWCPSLSGNTPERFRAALAEVRKRLEADGGPRIVTINAWNEWTEGSYLEPDTMYGMAYLEAVRDVFGAQGRPARAAPIEPVQFRR